MHDAQIQYRQKLTHTSNMQTRYETDISIDMVNRGDWFSLMERNLPAQVIAETLLLLCKTKFSKCMYFEKYKSHENLRAIFLETFNSNVTS
jgi:hypothetical protein